MSALDSASPVVSRACYLRPIQFPVDHHRGPFDSTLLRLTFTECVARWALASCSAETTHASDCSHSAIGGWCSATGVVLNGVRCLPADAIPYSCLRCAVYTTWCARGCTRVTHGWRTMIKGALYNENQQQHAHFKQCSSPMRESVQHGEYLPDHAYNCREQTKWKRHITRAQ